MRRHLRSCLLAVAMATAVGCTTPPAPPPLGLELQAIDSKSVLVHRAELTEEDGGFMLRGVVLRGFVLKMSREAHLDIKFLNATGDLLREEIVYFEPRILRNHPRRPRGRGRYLLPVPEIPLGTTKIEVRAHDEIHAGPQ